MSAQQLASRYGPRIGVGVVLAVLALGLAACSPLQGQSVEEEPTPTVTPAPTETPLPTETPEPTVEPTAEPPPEPPEARVRMTRGVNVRSGPSLTCAIIGGYPGDAEVEVRAQTPDRTWWRVPLEDTEGWVFAQNTVPVTDVDQVPEDPMQGCAAVTAGGGGAGATGPTSLEPLPLDQFFPILPTIGSLEGFLTPPFSGFDGPGSVIDCITNPEQCLENQLPTIP